VINPTDFLIIAGNFQTSSSEAERRTSIGRSYFALYDMLIDCLSAENVRFNKDGDDHWRLTYYLTKCGDRAADKMAGALKNLRFSRNLADYDLKASIGASQSEFSYKRAQSTISEIKSLLPKGIQRIAMSIRYLPPPPNRRRP